MTAHKDRPWLVTLAGALSGAGLASLRVSFAGNGASEGRFEEAVPSKEVEDLGSVLDALERWGVESIGYAGHSMGGAVGVLRAASDPRIACLVSLAGMVHVRRVLPAALRAPAAGRPDAGQAGVPVVAGSRRRRGADWFGDGTGRRASTCRGCWCTGTPTSSCRIRMRSTHARRPAGGPSSSRFPGVDHRFTGAIAAGRRRRRSLAARTAADGVTPWRHVVVVERLVQAGITTVWPISRSPRRSRSSRSACSVRSMGSVSGSRLS